MSKVILGVDVGGTSIKASLVDLGSVRLLDRFELMTPPGATPSGVGYAVHELATRCGVAVGSPVGICVPAVVEGGIVRTAANIHPRWIGTDAVSLFQDLLDGPVCVLNDADAAGTAELAVLPAVDQSGVVIVVTLGTGVGTAVFMDGQLLPNTELGHLTTADRLADTHVAFSAVRREGLDIATWTARVSEYLIYLRRLFSPKLFMVGGGGGNYFDLFSAQLLVGVPIVRARFGNAAGIIGSAMAAAPLAAREQ